MDQTSVYKTIYLKDIKSHGPKEEEWGQNGSKLKVS